MIDKIYLKKYLQKRKELETTIIRYKLLLSKEDISSPSGKTGISSGGLLESSTVENLVCKKILAEEKINKLEKDLVEQEKTINNPKIVPKSSTIFSSLIQKQLLAKIIQAE